MKWVWDWQENAACAGMDTEIFFPGEGESGRQAASKAIVICLGCPVLLQCRGWGDSVESSTHAYGVFGGETPKMRKTRRRKKFRESISV